MWRECAISICRPRNAKKKDEGSAQSHKELETTRSFMRADAPALAMAQTCPLNIFTLKKKNTFTFPDTTDVRSTLQKFFNIEIMRI